MPGIGRDERLREKPPQIGLSAAPGAGETERVRPRHARRTGSGVWELEPEVRVRPECCQRGRGLRGTNRGGTAVRKARGMEKPRGEARPWLSAAAGGARPRGPFSRGPPGSGRRSAAFGRHRGAEPVTFWACCFLVT